MPPGSVSNSRARAISWGSLRGVFKADSPRGEASAVERATERSHRLRPPSNLPPGAETLGNRIMNLMLCAAGTQIELGRRDRRDHTAEQCGLVQMLASFLADAR